MQTPKETTSGDQRVVGEVVEIRRNPAVEEAKDLSREGYVDRG